MKRCILNKIFIQSLKKYLTRFKDKKLTFLIFGGLGNQLTMASIAEIYSKEKGIKNIDFEYIKPRRGALRNCSLENYYYSKNYNIRYANLFLQKIYRTLVKFMILKKDIFLWKGMKLTILYLPFKNQVEINEIEFNMLSNKEYKNCIFKNTSLINSELNFSERKNIVIHFRDYSEELGNKGDKYQLKESYFINAIGMLKIPIGTSIDIICYKKPIKKFSKLSLSYNLNYLTNKFFSVEQSLEIMKNSKIFIMSNSTLSWWGGYGSNNNFERIVVFPVKDTEGLINWKKSYKLKDWIPCNE